MATIKYLKDVNNTRVYPVTHERAVRDSDGTTLESKLQNLESKTYIVAWDGNGAPTTSSIPSGVTVTYNGTTYTGSKSASASTVGQIYLVSDGNGQFNRYITSISDSDYSWVSLGSAAMNLEIINNLYDGGSTKALSAAMGKQLEGEIAQLFQEAIVKQLYTDGYISGVFGVDGYRKSSDGSLVQTTSETFKIFTFPVKAGATIQSYAKVDSDISAVAFSTDGNSWSSVLSGLGATSYRTYTYIPTLNGYVAVSCRADTDTRLDVSGAIFPTIADVENKTPFYPSAGKLVGGESKRIKFSDGTIIDDSTYQFFKIPVRAGARVYFSAYSYVADAVAIISFSADGVTWTPLVQYSNDSRYAEFFAGISEDGYVGLCHKIDSNYEPYLKVDYKTASDYNVLYEYGEPMVEPNRGIYTVSSIYVYTFSNTTRVLVHGIFVKPGHSFTVSVGGVSNLAIMNAGYLNNGSFVSKPSLSLVNGLVSGTMSSGANELAFTIKKSDNTAFSAAELAALEVKIIHSDSEIPRAQAMTAFMDAMRRKAAHIGMTSSTFNNPHGGYYEGNNSSTVADILKMALFACAYPRVWDFWSTNSETVQIYGANARTATITSTTQATLDTYYEEMHPGQTNPYYLLGKKGGGWSSSPKAYSFIGVTEIEGKYVVAVSATTQGDGTTGRVARLKGLIELFDIAAAYIAGQSIEDMAITQVENGIVAVLPELPNARKDQQPQIIYSLNPNAEYNPASTSKVLAFLTMMDIISDYEECHSILQEETSYNDSTYTAMAGDIETVNTSLFAMMVASNSANCMALARVCGEKLIKSRNESILTLIG